LSIRNAKKRDRKNCVGSIPALSASPMSSHFVDQCIGRNGTLKPVRKKAIKKMIRKGEVQVEEGGKGKIILIFINSGERFVVSKKKMKGITFLN